MKELSRKDACCIQVELLDELVKVCDEFGLYYTLGGGTLLGAVRHKGFIPWDDDIDVLMPRTDYEQLLKLDIENKIEWGENISLLNWKKGDFNYPYIKIANTKTTIHEKYMNISTPGYLWIDVFPIDGISNKRKDQLLIYKRILWTRKLFLVRNARLGEGKTFLKKCMKYCLKPILSVIPNKVFCKQMDKISNKYSFENEKTVAGILWGYGVQECMDKKQFCKSIPVEFEKKLYNAPSNYDKYLSGLYGNYMELPPKEEQINHEYKVFINSEVQEDKHK